MFRSLIHFEFIFVYGVRKCSSFILSAENLDKFFKFQKLDQFSLGNLKVNNKESTINNFFKCFTLSSPKLSTQW